MMNMNTPEDGRTLRFRIAFVCAALFFMAIVFLLNHFGELKAESVVKAETAEIAAEAFGSTSENENRPDPGERIRVKGSGGRYAFVFASEGGDHAARGSGGGLFFAVPTMGGGGAALSVFYFSPSSGMMFLGSRGAPRTADVADDRPGDTHAGRAVSSGILKIWMRRLSALADTIVEADADGRGRVAR